jgi:excisionase family DNA binding protein
MSQRLHTEPRLFTVKQVASMLNVSRSQIYTLFNTGQLGSVHIGNCRRVMDNQLEHYLSSLQNNTAQGWGEYEGGDQPPSIRKMAPITEIRGI